MKANPVDIRVRHLTRYNFNETVQLGDHRMMIRPRDSFDMRILETRLVINPAATMTWSHDVYGNSVATAHFSTPTDILTIESELVLRRYRSTLPRQSTEPWYGGAPVAYSPQERIVLQPFMTPALSDETGQLNQFANEAVTGAVAAGHPLFALSEAIHQRLIYNLRLEEGTQSPLDTLARGSGSCRDYAWLFIEAARQLGYAARFVSGYLHNINDTDEPSKLTASVGYSHAWAEVYVPGDGWIEIDPTNALVADRQLIRIAVTRTPQEASPISGAFTGNASPPEPDVSVMIEPVFNEPERLSA